MVKFPADMYAIDLDLGKPGTVRQASRLARELFGYDRLPAGTQLWVAPEKPTLSDPDEFRWR